MNILFGSGNYIGSNIMLSRFLNHIKHQDHNIYICAYYRNSVYLKRIDWCLDSLYYNIGIGKENYFESRHGIKGPRINHRIADTIINNLLELDLSLVISDCEFFTAMVAKVLEIPLWYCSSILQLTGINLPRKSINKTDFNTFKPYLKQLPDGERYLIYSPLCDIKDEIPLNKGFEWVRPYSNQPNITSNGSLSFIERAVPDNVYGTTGETSFVSDCIYSGRSFFVCPDSREIEQNLNAQLLDWCGVAKNIGWPRDVDFVSSKIERLYNPPALDISDTVKQLDELI